MELLQDGLVAAAAIAMSRLMVHLVRTCHERWILSDAKRTKRAVRMAKAKR